MTARLGAGSGATHVAVVGAGFSGSLTAIILDRLGFRVTLIDRYAVFPNLFAAEQLVGSQVKILGGLKVLESMVGDLPLIPKAEAYTRGKKHRTLYVPHYGLSYQDMVQALRRQIPPASSLLWGALPQWNQVSVPPCAWMMGDLSQHSSWC